MCGKKLKKTFKFLDLRIKQEPMTLTDRERVEKLAERLSGEVFSSNRGFETSNYGMISDQKQNVAPFNHGIISLAHPPTPEHSPAPSTPARWNSKINKAGTVSTPDGKFMLQNSVLFYD